MSSQSSTTGNVLGTVGAAVGFYFGGPGGASAGYQIGSGIGNLLDPPKVPTQQGPRLSDLGVQSSTYGENIPRLYGTVKTTGNVFWLEKNKLKEVSKKKLSGGKGGGSSIENETFTYYATFAVGLCQGPIAGVRRIWVGADLMYDSSSSDLETAFATGNASKYFTIYNGSDTQQPDSRMQADIGVPNCPAFRGLAYIVVKDLPLAKYGNSLAGAQIKVELQSVAGFASANVGEVQVERDIDGFYSTVMAYFDSNGTSHIFSNGEYLRKGLTGATERMASILPPITSNMAQCYCADEPLMVVLDYPYHKVYNSLGALVAKIEEPHVIPTVTQIVGCYYFSGGRGYVISPNSAQNTTKIFEFTYAPQIDSVVTPLTEVYSGSYGSGSTIDDLIPIDGAYFCLTRDMHLQKRDASFAVLWSHDMNALYSLTGGAGWGGGDRVMLRANDDESCVMFKHSILSIYRATEYGVDDLSAAGLSTGFTSYGGMGGAALSGDTLVVCSVGADPGPVQIRFISLNSTTTGVVTLGEIVEAEALLSGILLGPDLDLAALTQPVSGYIVSKAGSIRSAIEPLRSAWPFDVIQSGYKLKAVPRGQASVADAVEGDLGVDEQLTQSREMDIQLPQRVTVRHFDSGRSYDINEQSSSRDNTESVNVSILDLPIVLSAAEAAQVSERLLRLYMLERTEFSFSLPPTFAHLEPGDVVTLTMSYGVFELRLVTVNYTSTGALECTARPNSASTYISTVTGDAGLQDPDTIPVEGSSTALLIDCAVVDDSVQDAPGFILAMYGAGTGWSGGTLFRSADGNKWEDLQGVVGSVPAGSAITTLAAHEGHLIDLGSTLSVELYAGSLESVTESQMLNGSNVVAYGADGRWEILRFMDATLELDGTYTLSGFWRGDRGTEWATGLHEPYDKFVLISDADAAFIGTSSDQIGVSRDYRAITGGAAIDSALTQPFVYAGENLECLSGVQAKGVRAADDLTITWQRRTRVGGAWRSYVDASLGEAVESYQIDIYNGPTVVRTISAATPSALYSAADQTTDFGAPQASIEMKIYQMSAAVGRGHPLEVTL